MLIRNFKRAIEISRPIFWPSTFFAFIFGVIFSHNLITPVALLFAFVWSFPYSLWLCTVNDVADKESDDINIFKGGISGAKIEYEEFKLLNNLKWISLFVIVVPTLLTGNMYLIIGSAIALVVPYIYSTKPIRLKERPPFDSLSNGLFAASVFFAGYVFNSPLHFEVYFYQAFLGFLLGVSAIHVLAALRDYTVDKKTQTTTIAVRWGIKRSAFLAAILFSFVYISIYNFPFEFRLYALTGVFVSVFLMIKRNEHLSGQSVLFLLFWFFVVSGYSIVFNSWSSFFGGV